MKQLKITNITESEGTYTFDNNLFVDGEFKSGTNGDTRTPAEGEDRDTMFRNMCDTDIEVFVDEVSIGFGTK